MRFHLFQQAGLVLLFFYCTYGTNARSDAQLAQVSERSNAQAGSQQLQDVKRVFQQRTRMERRQAVTLDFSGPRTSTSGTVVVPPSSSSGVSTSSIISSPATSSSSSVSPPSSSNGALPSVSSPVVPTLTATHISLSQQLFADLPPAVLLGADVEDLPGPASGVPALIPGLVALLIVLSLWATCKKLPCPFTLLVTSNAMMTVAALTLLISTTRGPSTLAALCSSSSIVTRFVWLALTTKALCKLSLATQQQRTRSTRPDQFGFSSSSLPNAPNEVQRSRYAVVRVVIWTLLIALGIFETAWRLALALSGRKLTTGLMCTANVLQALLLVVLVAAMTWATNAAPREAKWRRRGAGLVILASTIGFAVAVANVALHGLSEAPLGRLLILCENLLYLAAATMFALPLEHRDIMRRSLPSLRRSCTAPPPYHRSMSEKGKERQNPLPKATQHSHDDTSPDNGTIKGSTLMSIKRKTKLTDVVIEPFALPTDAPHVIDVSLSAPTSPTVTALPNAIQDRPELMRSISSPNGPTHSLLPCDSIESTDQVHLTILRPASALTSTSDERHANSAIIVAVAPTPAPERDVARMVSLTRGRSKGSRSVAAVSIDSPRNSLPPPVPVKQQQQQLRVARSSTFSAESTVESSRGACGEDLLDNFPTPPASSYPCGMPDSVRSSAAMSESAQLPYLHRRQEKEQESRVELAYAPGEDEIYILPEAPGLRRSSSRTHVSVTSFMSTLAARSGLSAFRQAHTPSSLSMAPSSDAIMAPQVAPPAPSSPALITEPTSDAANGDGDGQLPHYGTSPPRTLLLLPEVTLAESDTSSMYVDDSGVWDVPVSPGLPRSRGGSGRSSLIGAPNGESTDGSTKANLGHALNGSTSSAHLLTPTGWKRTSIPIAASPLRRSFDNGLTSDEDDDASDPQRSSFYVTPRNSIRTPLGWTKEDE